MDSRRMEIGVGLFVAVGLAALLVLAMKVSNLSALTESDGYRVIAHFDNVGGLKVRSPVKMAGVLIGRVVDIEFDSKDYTAVVTMAIRPEYDRIPTDTSASIFTAGLLGEQYIGLEAGGEEKYLQAGDEISLTQSAVVLEQLIGQFLYSKGSEPRGGS